MELQRAEKFLGIQEEKKENKLYDLCEQSLIYYLYLYNLYKLLIDNKIIIHI